MTESRFIAVGIDESPESVDAALWAAHVAVADGAALKLVNAVAPIEWLFGATVAFSPEGLRDKLTSDAQAVLDAADAKVRAAAPNLTTETVVVHGKVADVLGRASEGARLLVVASGSSGSRVSVLGGQVTKVVAHAAAPVVVWRKAAAVRTGPQLPVVAGVDESDASQHALRVAFDVARLLQAPVDVAHMWETSAAVGLGYGEGPTDWQLQDVLKAQQEEAIEKLVAPIAHDFPHVRTHSVRADTTPAKGLTELSEQAQLLVVGTRGRGRVTGALLGSVSLSLLHHAQCPVLVVPPAV